MITHNGQTYKVVVVTPSGREEFMDIYKKFIFRKIDEGLIDEWQLWVNTVKPEDLAFLARLEAEHEKVKRYRIRHPIEPTYNNCNPMQTYEFFQYTQADDTIYIRCDDDIVWAADDALEKICQARIDHPEAFIIYPNVINSTVTTSWHQENGALNEGAGRANRKEDNPTNPDHVYLCEFSYADSRLAEHIHKTFQQHYRDNTLSAYYLSSRSLTDYQRFSICTVCWFGKDHLQGQPLEEQWLAWEEPERLGRPVWFCGDALLVHFGYHTQIDHLRTKPEYLQFFREITK